MFGDGKDDCMVKDQKEPVKSRSLSLERRAECQTESKAFAKSTVARTVRAPGLDCGRNLRLTVREGEPGLQSIYQV